MADANQNGCLVVGQGVLINGRVSLPEKLVVDGQIEGDITAKDLQVGESGKITGKLTVANADVRGELVDTISVSETLILRSTARVRGNVVYNALQIEQGAVVEGTLNRMNSSQPVAATYGTSAGE